MVSPTGHQTRAALIVLAATSGYALLAYGSLTLTDNLVVALLFAILAFLAAIGSYYAVMRATAMGARRPLIVVAILTTILAAVIAPAGSILKTVFDMLTIYTGGYLVGFLVSRRKGLGRSYIIGGIWILIACVIQYWDIWPTLIETMKQEGNKLVTWFEANPAFKSASKDMQDEMLSNMKTWVLMSARLSPASMIMLPITQLSIGYLWFLLRGVKDKRLSLNDIRFTRWKAPWELSAPLIVATALRLLGGESLQLIADNAIMIMAIYYCVTGLALVSWFLKTLKMALWFRVMFFVFLIITGVLGFVLVSIAGFIDSFRDFRKGLTIDLNLKKN